MRVTVSRTSFDRVPPKPVLPANPAYEYTCSRIVHAEGLRPHAIEHVTTYRVLDDAAGMAAVEAMPRMWTYPARGNVLIDLIGTPFGRVMVTTK